MKLHFLLVCGVAIGLLSSAPDSFARGGGGGGRGGGSFHGGFHGGFRGGFRGRGGRFFRGRFFGPGFGFFGYGYPWWGWYDWGYPYYPYYGYYGDYGSGYYGSGDYGSDPSPSYGSNANYGGTRDSAQDPRFSTTRGVQAALAWRGYYNGRIDGVMGPETSAAIRSFQAHQGLPTTGQIDSGLVNALQRR
jgi:hypothetical protein